MVIVSNLKDFYSGDNLNLTIGSNLYKSTDDYVLRIVLLNASKPKLEYIADVNLDGTWSIKKTSVETSLIEADKYHLFYIFSKSVDGFAKQEDGGFITVKQNIIDSVSFDSRTNNQKQLEAVREAIAGRITEGIASFSIGGRTVGLMSITDLHNEEKRLISLVNAELNLNDLRVNGKTNRNKLKIRYTGLIL